MEDGGDQSITVWRSMGRIHQDGFRSGQMGVVVVDSQVRL